MNERMNEQAERFTHYAMTGGGSERRHARHESLLSLPAGGSQRAKLACSNCGPCLVCESTCIIGSVCEGTDGK